MTIIDLIPPSDPGGDEVKCFSDIGQSGIPSLQEWCHNLATATPAQHAKRFNKHLAMFARSMEQQLKGIGAVSRADRANLRQKWESKRDERTGVATRLSWVTIFYGYYLPRSTDPP